jgi:DNA-binding response OmpR family regulator
MQKKTLLLVAGSHVLMDITKKILERHGYSVRCAFGIAGAEEQLGDGLPQGIIMDIRLPDGDGLEYCLSLKKKYAMPIMLLSGDTDDELSAFKAGAEDFMKQPFNYDILKARLLLMMRDKTIDRKIKKGIDKEEF